MGFFFGLKGMANVPVESMKYGGLFWFTDLTICDPFYILPFITSATIWAVMEVIYFVSPYLLDKIYMFFGLIAGSWFCQIKYATVAIACLHIQSNAHPHVSFYDKLPISESLLMLIKICSKRFYFIWRQLLGTGSPQTWFRLLKPASCAFLKWETISRSNG